MARQEFDVQGMHCGSCVAKITSALKQFGKVTVTLDPPKAVLESTSAANIGKLNAAVAQAGDYSLSQAVEGVNTPVATEGKGNWLQTYYPLVLIVGLIAAASCKGATSGSAWMMNFMSGFFIVFGFFKLLDLRGFRDAYATYDLLAMRWNTYGLIYPFLELALGFAFLFHFALVPALWASIALMGFGSLGVIRALSKNQKIRCACLGTVLNLPMSTITLVEDLGMVVMAWLMLIGIAAAPKTHIIQQITDAPAGKFYFLPQQLTIQPGDTVQFVNAQDESHDVMFVRVPRGVSGMIMSPLQKKKGDTFSYTFTIPGTYEYHCHPHEGLGMKGTLIVGQASKPGETKELDHDSMEHEEHGH